MKVSVIKYNAGNVKSVILALKRLGVEPIYTDDPETILKSDKVIFPGQGEASSAMNYLKERGLDMVIKTLSQPTLGICLGQQLFCKHTEEGDTKCLNLIPIEVKKFTEPKPKLVIVKTETGMETKVENQRFKIPQIGWNNIYNLKNPLFKGIPENSFVYFIHSYYVEQSKYTIASTDYADIDFASAIQKDNFFATQFHPEKSGDIGSKILKNFLEV